MVRTRLKPNEYRVLTNVSLLNIKRRSIVYRFSNDIKPGFLHLSNFKIRSIPYIHVYHLQTDLIQNTYLVTWINCYFVLVNVPYPLHLIFTAKYHCKQILSSFAY